MFKIVAVKGDESLITSSFSDSCAPKFFLKLNPQAYWHQIVTRFLKIEIKLQQVTESIL